MNRIFRNILILTAALLLSGFSVYGQDNITVKGRILDTVTRKPFDSESVSIIICKSQKEADKASKDLKEHGFIFARGIYSPDRRGYYKVNIPENSVIVVSISGYDAIYMESVDGRSRIDFNIAPSLIDAGVVSVGTEDE